MCKKVVYDRRQGEKKRCCKEASGRWWCQQKLRGKGAIVRDNIGWYVVPEWVSVYQLEFPVGQPMRSYGGAVMPNTGAGVKSLDVNREEQAMKH
jgi:hypothetical protein